MKHRLDIGFEGNAGPACTSAEIAALAAFLTAVAHTEGDLETTIGPFKVWLTTDVCTGCCGARGGYVSPSVAACGACGGTGRGESQRALASRA